MLSLEELKKRYPLQFGENNPILRAACDPIGLDDVRLEEIAYALDELVWVYEGVGLAAPQIGQSVRMAAITQWDTSGKKRKLIDQFVMINPQILGSSDDQLIDEEGCLSLPGATGKVSRPSSITVKFHTPDGNEVIHKADGYNARIILHEIDHLDGVLFVDKLV